MKLNQALHSGAKDFEIDYRGMDKIVLNIAESQSPEAVFYNDNSVISILKISGEYSGNKNRHVFEHDEEGYELLYDEIEYFKYLKEKIKDESKSKIIMNLLFDIHKKFNKFHVSWDRNIPQDKPRLLFCGLLCSSKDKKSIGSSLEFLYTSFNFRDSYKESIPKIDVKGYVAFLIDISTFYHMTSPNLFAVKKGFASKQNLIKGEKCEVIGKNDFYAQDDPQRNRYHPDALSVEQKIRVGLSYQKALEFIQN